MCYERQASRTGVLSLLRTVHCDLEIVNHKLLTVTSASETWIHSQWIGDCAECSWSVTCVLLIELFSFMHVFSISVLTFSAKRVWSTFFGGKARIGNCWLWGSNSNPTPAGYIAEADAIFNCSAPFMHSPAVFWLYWAEVMVARLFSFWQCELFAMNVELWTARFDRLNWLDLAHLLKIKPNAFVWS